MRTSDKDRLADEQHMHGLLACRFLSCLRNTTEMNWVNELRN